MCATPLYGEDTYHEGAKAGDLVWKYDNILHSSTQLFQWVDEDDSETMRREIDEFVRHAMYLYAGEVCS